MNETRTISQQKKRQRLLNLATASGPVKKPALTISDLSALAVREPVSQRAYLILSLKTDAGIIGRGETTAEPDPLAAVAAILQHRQQLVGQDALAAEALLHRLSGLLGPQQGRFLAAVNMALLDILGQRCKAPICEVLTGPTRTKVRVLTRLLDTPADKLPLALPPLYKAGHRAFVVPLPTTSGLRGPTYPRQTLDQLTRIREALGADADLVLDGGGQLTPREAAGVARAIERFHVLFFDEPVSHATASSLQRIAEEFVVPLAVGRNEMEIAGMRELLRAQAMDVPRPNYSHLPITAIRKLAAHAETHYVAVAPVHEAGPLTTAAALQVAASLPNFFIQQIPLPADERDRQMRQELVGTAIEAPTGGFLSLPTGPGLGVTLNEDAVRKYQVK